MLERLEILYLHCSMAPLSFPLDIKESLADLARWLIEKDITVFTCVTSIFRHAVKNLSEKNSFPGCA